MYSRANTMIQLNSYSTFSTSKFNSLWIQREPGSTVVVWQYNGSPAVQWESNSTVGARQHSGSPAVQWKPGSTVGARHIHFGFSIHLIKVHVDH